MNEIDRIKELREGLPAPRPQSRDAARAALMERFEASAATSAPAPRAPRRRLFGRRGLSLAGAVAGLAAAILIATGSGGGPTVKPEVASAADLRRLATISPNLLLAGIWWELASTEASPVEGRTRFHLTPRASANPAFSYTSPSVELRWRSVSAQQRDSELAAEGLVDVGPAPVIVNHRDRPYGDKNRITESTAQVYFAKGLSEGLHQAVGVWQGDGWALELRAGVRDFESFERLLERVSYATPEEWVIALQPGGLSWLNQHVGGVVEVEREKIGETPDGRPIFSAKGSIEGSNPDEPPKSDFTRSLPVIYRDGDQTKVVVTEPPPNLRLPPP